MNRTNRRIPRPSTILAIAVAGIATFNAYQAMVAFAVDMLGMDHGTAYATAGVFELSLFTVAVLAREAAKDNRPNGVLLTLTWVLSGASGVFAAIHEYDLGHAVGAILFRLSVPMLAALMWHLALIGERHLAAGVTWQEGRRNRAMQAMYEAAEEALRLSGTRREAIAQARYRRARHKARRLAPPNVMIHQTPQWDAASAAETMTIVTARDNHARQQAAFANRRVENMPTVPVVVPRPATKPNDPTPTAPAPVAVVQPTPAPAASTPAPAPAYAQTAASTSDTAVTVTAPVPGEVRKCLGCGNELPANANPRARFCSRKNPDGTRDQTCKNRYNHAKRKAESQRATIARTLDELTQAPQQRTAFA